MNISVLAIDDSLTIRTLLTQSLTSAGFDVTTAVDGEDGLQKFKEIDADVVITDMNMPKLDGFGVIKGIRSGDGNSSVPIIVLTTESSQALKDRAKTEGATGWIVKPFTDSSLISTLELVAGA